MDNQHRLIAGYREFSETEIALKELVEDQSGEWAERVSTLQLQEQAPQEAKK